MVTRARVLTVGGLAALILLIALVVLIENPTSNPPRLRERIVLSDDVASELTGATVSIRGESPITIDVVVGGESICNFESGRPKNHLATIDGETWVVVVRRIDNELRTIDVRVDRVPDSGEADGCLTADRGGG